MSSPSLQKCLLVGSFGFCAASLLVFSTVAFGERWMYQNLGLPLSYLVWTLLFIASSALVFNSLVNIPLRGARFYLLFSAAFIAYAAAWCGAYFVLRGVKGEWLGSLAGTVLMAAVFAAGLRKISLLPVLATLLFITHSAGYFLGSVLHSTIGGPTGMILWGVSYGLLFGAGIGALLYFAQKSEG